MMGADALKFEDAPAMLVFWTVLKLANETDPVRAVLFDY